MGAANYGYSVFIVPLEQALQVTRFELLLVPSLMRVATGLMSPFLGRAFDRGPIRAWMIGGSLLLCGGFALASQASAIWQIAGLYASVIALGTIAAGPVAASTVVAKWFVAARGRALGIAAVGTSLGGVVLPPLISGWIDAFGWRSAYLALAVAAPCVIAPGAWLFVHNRPEDVGLSPDGDTAPPSSANATTPAPGGLEWRDLLRHRNFWAIVLAYGFSSIGFGGVLYNLVPFAMDRGFDAPNAALLLSVLTASGVLGKLSVGFAADRIDPRHVWWIAMTACAVGVGGIALATHYAALVPSVALFGLGTGGLYPLFGVLVGAAFGRESFGRALGLMGTFTMAMSLPAAPLAGWVYDRTGSYDPAFAVLPLAFALGALLLLLLRLPPKTA